MLWNRWYRTSLQAYRPPNNVQWHWSNGGVHLKSTSSSISIVKSIQSKVFNIHIQIVYQRSSLKTRRESLRVSLLETRKEPWSFGRKYLPCSIIRWFSLTVSFDGFLRWFSSLEDQHNVNKPTFRWTDGTVREKGISYSWSLERWTENWIAGTHEWRLSNGDSRMEISTVRWTVKTKERQRTLFLTICRYKIDIIF